MNGVSVHKAVEDWVISMEMLQKTLSLLLGCTRLDILCMDGRKECMLCKPVGIYKMGPFDNKLSENEV